MRLATSLDLAQYIPEHAQRQLEGICDHAQLLEVLRYSGSPAAGADHRAEVTITPPFIGNTVRLLCEAGCMRCTAAPASIRAAI